MLLARLPAPRQERSLGRGVRSGGSTNVCFRFKVDIEVGVLGTLVPALNPWHACNSEDLGEALLKFQGFPLLKRV